MHTLKQQSDAGLTYQPRHSVCPSHNQLYCVIIDRIGGYRGRHTRFSCTGRYRPHYSSRTPA